MGSEYENIEFGFNNLTRRPSNDIPSLIPSQKAFLEVVDKTFRGVLLNRDLIFSWFMSTVRGVFAKEGYLKPWVLWAFVSLLFFEKLGVLPAKARIQKGGDLMAELGEKAEEFFGSYQETFRSSAHKALFLLGVLSQKLLNIQYRDRNATPFRKNLKGLRLREGDFQGLLPKIQNKLEEYDKNYYRKLEELISEYLIRAGRGWQMTTDEMNFYFVLGMNLQDKVSQILGIAREEESQ
jgi:CRISPR-associated protein Csh1